MYFDSMDAINPGQNPCVRDSAGVVCVLENALGKIFMPWCKIKQFAYDAQGRMAWQRRGSLATSSAGGEYHYAAGKNQLAWVDAGMQTGETRVMTGSVASPAFVYDLNGNMTDDNSKDMSVVYDHRNMPLSFVRTGVDSDYLVENRYDASGNRVSKVVFTRSVANGSAGAWTFANATHYTGVGNEIRENAGVVDAKVVVNMPQGLGRYAAGSNNSFEWYLKNHLGSTMLVYNTGSANAVKAAYDYRAYGKRVSIATSSERVTEEYTGKELDEETDLNYYGARFLDAELGLWIGVDPRRQFASPYLLVGSGINPVISLDPDGRKIVVMGTPRFQAEVHKGLTQMRATPSGQELYDELENSDRIVTIIPTTGGNEAQRVVSWTGLNILKASFGADVPGDAIVSWNDSKTTGGTDVDGSDIRPPFIGLTHEFGHALDYIRGIFRSNTDSHVVNGAIVPDSETQSVEVENDVRSENFIPERSGY